jgi:quercetin dioxygenase-like cupin family protein
MWPLLLAIATAGASMAAKSGQVHCDSSSATVVIARTEFSRTFLSGLCLGAGLQLLVSEAFNHFRILERLRLYWNKSWVQKEDAPWRLPQNFVDAGLLESDAKDYSHTLVDSSYGSIRLLVTPHNAATSTLHMSVIALAPGCELSSARAASLEVYQVLSGTGLVSQQGIHAASEINAGQLWVVDSGCVRWISNNGTKTSTPSTTQLVLLRVVDRCTTSSSTYGSADSELNRIVLDPGQRTRSIVEQFVSASMRHITRVASDYFQKISTSNLRG